MTEMFSVTISVVVDNPYGVVRDLFPHLNEAMGEFCSTVKIGGSVLCAPDPFTLITVVVEMRELKPLNLKITVRSTDAQKVVEYSERISKMISGFGYHSTLLSS